MKLTYEQKVNAYKKWKELYKSTNNTSHELGINYSYALYFLRLIDKYGVEIQKLSLIRYSTIFIINNLHICFKIKNTSLEK